MKNRLKLYQALLDKICQRHFHWFAQTAVLFVAPGHRAHHFLYNDHLKTVRKHVKTVSVLRYVKEIQMVSLQQFMMMYRRGVGVAGTW